MLQQHVATTCCNNCNVVATCCNNMLQQHVATTCSNNMQCYGNMLLQRHVATCGINKKCWCKKKLQQHCNLAISRPVQSRDAQFIIELFHLCFSDFPPGDRLSSFDLLWSPAIGRIERPVSDAGIRRPHEWPDPIHPTWPTFGFLARARRTNHPPRYRWVRFQLLPS